jgi:hypothetical protein
MAFLVGVVALLASANHVRADSYSVLVGYADGLRSQGFFPNPWFGDPGVVFVGTTPQQGAPDAGAVRIDNTDSVAHSYHVVVGIPNTSNGGSTTSFDLWGNVNVPAGGKLILTQTGFYNFDTSDIRAIPGANKNHPAPPNVDPPIVSVSVDGGMATDFLDTGHVLDTNGFDYASVGNESFAWRPIGTNGTPSGVPVPASLVLLGVGASGLLGYRWVKRRRPAEKG